MKTILLATDGSPCARRATNEAIELARATGWGLHVVTVWNIPLELGYGFTGVIPEVIDAQREHAHNVAEHTTEEARIAGIDATYELREGIPADEIVAAAHDLEPELLVIGAHGWGPVKRILVGSVSTSVLHDAPCPVLVVRSEATAERPDERERVAAEAVR